MATILFYPYIPLAHNKVYILCHDLRIRMTHDLSADYDVAWLWSENTIIKETIKTKKKIINQNCTDVSKSHVEKVFEKIFGYTSLINPLEFKGLAVEKSEHQCRQNAQIVQCPIQPKPEMIYQKLIDNKINGEFTDIRVPYMNGEIPLVILKTRVPDKRFSNVKGAKIEKNPNNILSDIELIKIKKFCKEFGLDFGDLDILRDNDGKIYIVDVNNTCGNGIWFHLAGQELKYMEDIFKKYFLKTIFNN